MAYAPKSLLPLAESKALEGVRGSTYWCMLAILCSLFFHSFFLILPFFSFHFLSQFLLICCDSLLEITIAVFLLLCTAKVLYIMPTVTRFYHFRL